MVLLQQSGCTSRSPEFTFEEVCIIWDDDGLPTTHSCCSVHVSRQGAWLTSLCNVLATAETVSPGADCDCHSAIHLVNHRYGMAPVVKYMLLSCDAGNQSTIGAR